jgi:hypothetical protein
MAITKKIQQISPYTNTKIKGSDVFPIASLTGTGYATFSVSGVQIFNYIKETFTTTSLIVSSISCKDIQSTNLTSIYISSTNLNATSLTSVSLTSTNISAQYINTNSLSSITLSANTINTTELSSLSLSANTISAVSLSSLSLSANTIYTDSLSCTATLSSKEILADTLLINGNAGVSKINFTITHVGSNIESIYILPNLFNSLDVMVQVCTLNFVDDVTWTDVTLADIENFGDQIIITVLHPTDVIFNVLMIG